ncbi:MAG: hypothetical protein RBR87_07055 [Bacteroidales bacterium]|jgi:hypothetical protein|nr:hypothetical protein [Bacteroidales bacterium]
MKINKTGGLPDISHNYLLWRYIPTVNLFNYLVFHENRNYFPSKALRYQEQGDIKKVCTFNAKFGGCAYSIS